MDIGTRKQLLFDDRFLEESEGISLCLDSRSGCDL